MVEAPLQNHTFETTDTAIAAYLCYLGFRLIKIDSASFRSIFIFERTSEAIDQAANSFEASIAVGNIPLFFRQYKKLLNEVTKAKDNNANSRAG